MSADSRIRNAMDDADTVVDRGQDRGDGYKNRILGELKTLVGDAERLFRQAAETSSDKLSGMRAQFDRRIDQTRDQIDRTRRLVNRNAERSTAATRDYVRENPLRSVGIATAAGVIVGLVVMSILNDRR